MVVEMLAYEVTHYLATTNKGYTPSNHTSTLPQVVTSHTLTRIVYQSTTRENKGLGETSQIHNKQQKIDAASLRKATNEDRSAPSTHTTQRQRGEESSTPKPYITRSHTHTHTEHCIIQGKLIIHHHVFL